MISQKIKEHVRDVLDFPKPGIVFKDITPILKDPFLCDEIVEALSAQATPLHVDAIAGIESRGFLFGLALAQHLKVPFIPIRKAGKLPYKTIRQAYKLEYGEAVLEIHEDAFEKGQRVLVRDDLLATGGTVIAASALIEKSGAAIAGYSFIINLDFLNGKERLKPFSSNIFSLVDY